MKNINLKSLLPHVIAILFFATLSVIYFKPVFSGKELRQDDITRFKGMAQEIVEHREKYKEEPLWTNSMFGGMPAYQISVKYTGNLIRHFDKILTLGLPHPVNIVFLYFLGFYILMMTLRINPWIGVLGSIAFAFSSYFFVILEAGHNSKAHAIGYMAPVLAGFILTMRGKFLLGGILTALFLSLEIYANHPQITYYLFLLLLIYAIAEFIHSFKNKAFSSFFKSCGTLIVAGVIALGCNAASLWATYDYGKYTTRGKSELTINPDGTSNKGNVTSGLDKDYATQWSYGTGETMTLMIPDFKGGSSGAIGNTNKDALKKVDPQFKQSIAQSDQYWGDQPFTSGPVYAGAIIIFLFVLGWFFVEGRVKWVLIIATALAILLSWGHNFMWFTELFLDHFPMYNKFRTVTMILSLAELTIPLLAVLALSRILEKKNILTDKTALPLYSKPVSYQNLFYTSFALTGGLCLLYFLMPGSLTTFFKTGEYDDIFSQIAKSNSEDIATAFLENLERARQAIFKSDAIRSFIFILLGAGTILIYLKQRFDSRLLFGALIVFVLIDMWNVNRRYINDKSFVPATENKVPFQPSTANLAILEDKDPNYRVLNLAASTFQDAGTSYFHKSIGGYHGAKLKRYQEMFDFHFMKSFQNIITALQTNPTEASINSALKAQPALNMLNTRYIIYNAEAPPLKNPASLGNAWFVKEIKLVENADKEILALNNFDPATTVIVDQKFKEEVQGFTFKGDTTASIKLTQYKANHLVYESNSATEQLAIFSEIYYKSGWNAYIDGNSAPYFRANYILRGMKIPAGKHKIEFKFEPTIYKTGETISLASSVLLLILLFAIAFIEIIKGSAPKA